MIRSFFSKKLFGLSAVISVTLSTQLVFLPVAQASERSEQLHKYVQADFLAKATRFMHDAESDGFRIQDAKGNAMSPESFLETGGTEFYLISPETETDPSLSYRMRIHPQSSGLPTISVAVTRPGHSRVLARRAFALDYNEDATTLRMKLNETEQSLATQLRKAIGERHASVWQKAGRVLQGLFGVPSAHAGLKPLHAGVKAALGLAGIGVVLYVVTHVTQKAGLLNKKVALGVVIVGVVTAAALYWFTYGGEASVTPQPVPVGDDEIEVIEVDG